MLVMRTVEDPAHPFGKLVCSEQSISLDHLSLPVNPFRLDGVQPRALLRKEAAHDPHPLATVLDAAVVPSEPSPDLLGDMPTGVVPDEQKNLLALRFELLRTPSEKPSGYGRDRPSVPETQPHLSDLLEVESVAAYGLRLRIVSCDRPLDESERLTVTAPGIEGGKRHPAPPAFVLEAYRPLGVGPGDFHQSVAPPFFARTRGRGR
jgi:hypothetical protein